MKHSLIAFLLFLLFSLAPLPQASPHPPDSIPVFSAEALQKDFREFRRILEEEHCCLYEYTPKVVFDSLFESAYSCLDRPMRREEFFRVLAPITARIGCLHTATWMPQRFFNTSPDRMFPLKVTLIDANLVVTGSYLDSAELPAGTIIKEINGKSSSLIIKAMQSITGADALNPYFIDAQFTHRFPMFYASYFGIPEKYEVTCVLPWRETDESRILTPANIEAVRSVVFAHFRYPPLKLSVNEQKSLAVLTISTFIYYDRRDYFRNFIDSTFKLIEDQGIENLILDLRGNGGGDAYCAVHLFSYLEKYPAPYFAEPYHHYEELAKPVPLAENHFTGRLYTLIDGACGSTNGHFVALLKYNDLGEFIGTPSGSTFKCNAGRDTEFNLEQTGLIITIGRSTYTAAVSGMDKAAPVMPDYPVEITLEDIIEGNDPVMQMAMDVIESSTP